MSDRRLLPVATGKRTWAVVGGLLREQRGLAALTFLTIAGATAIGLTVPPLLGRIVDLVAARDPGTSLTWPVVALVAAALAQGVVMAVGLSMVARLGESILAQLRENFIERALHLPLSEVEEAGSGDLTSRVTNDVSVIAKGVREALPELAKATLAIALTLGALTVLDWRFLLAAVVAAPVQYFALRRYVRSAIPLYAEQRIAVGAQQQQLLDSIGGARTVRAFRLADDHVDRVGKRSGAAVDLVLRGIRLLTNFYARLNYAELIGLGAVLVTGFLLVRNGSVSIGTATAAALYFHNLFGPISTALVLVDDAQASAASLSRMIGVSDLPAPAEPKQTPAPVDASVKVAGVGHAYVEGHAVLHEVSVQIGTGERVALVGASGAGKTTLAKLIAGIHPPGSGGISLGGVALDELGPAATRRLVALVNQETHVFAGTLAEDLRLAAPAATEDELTEALATVGALDWAKALPAGLSTVVGDGGHRLTVTQSQQLALARLMLTDPPIVILDEATAEAGSAGARVLEASALAALEGRTGLMVAHRLSQAATADRIIVLDAGQVVETGTHQELVTAGGRYATLWAAWSGQRN